MKRVAVIGAGVSGLSMSQLLSSECEVDLYEASSRPGGLIKCDLVNGKTFHLTGGACF